MKKPLIFFFAVTTLFAQPSNLYMSQPIIHAYENGTRSLDGSPGKNYWVNRAEYDILASVDIKTKKLTGELEVVYFNNSPDTLNKIVMHLYPDLFKNGTSRDWPLPEAALNEGVVIHSLSVNGEEFDVTDTSAQINRSTTNMNVKLTKPLTPSEKIDIKVKWSFIIPFVRPIRTGAYTDSTMFVAYWYPKIAVYDDINGWDELTYTGQSEMYSGVSSYNVKVTAPQNYVVWSTGLLQNAEDVFSGNVLSKFEEARQSDKIIDVISKDDLIDDVTKGENSTWHYIAKSSPDFAFAIAKNYLWDATTVELENKKVFVSAAYDQNAKNYTEVARITKEGVKFFSNKMPAVEFPYPSITVFNGSGGMEFPMMLNDGETSTLSSTVGLTLHELAHTYLPFYMGINERRYAFMDEGWAVFGPVELQKRLGDEFPLERRFKRQEKQLEGVVEVPPMTPSYHLKSPAYRVASYTRSSAALFALQDLLGKEIFLKAINTFVKEWKEKHPTPYDLFFTFNRLAEEDLSWFWKPWFFEFHSPDLNLKEYINQDGKKFVKIENAGGLPLSVKLKIYFADNTTKTLEVSPRVWKSGGKTINVDLETDKQILEIELGDELIPDVNYSKRETIEGD